MKAPAVTENHEGYNVRIIKGFEKSKSCRKCIKRYIIYNTPQALTMKSFLFIDFRIYLEVN